VRSPRDSHRPSDWLLRRANPSLRAAGAAVLAACLSVGASADATPPASSCPPPEAVLGFRPGDDGRLADWSVVRTYLEALASASRRVRLESVGPTTEGRPFLIVTITSEGNQRQLERIRQDNLRLADPRHLAAGEAERLVEGGRVVLAMTYGVHSTEVGGTLSALRFAHLLATTAEPALVRSLENAVVVLVPSLNPDGNDRVAAWARRQKGTPFEGTEPPELCHRYAGHDINRDGYAFLLDETRLLVRHLHDRWRPQVVHDVHQMGAFGPRMFLPPYLEPWEPNVDPALRDAGAALGSSVADGMTRRGFAGIVTSALFDAWSPARAFVHTHGGVRILSETASARLALPRDVGFEELRAGPGVDPRTRAINFPLLWPGGRWRIGDVVEYQVEASRSLLETVAARRRDWLQRFLEVNRRAGSSRKPYAFLIPTPPRDGLALVELERVLLTGGVELWRATEAFAAEGRSFGRGTIVVLMQQPWSAFARTILERQTYPGMADGAPLPSPSPYDVTAHTLPLLLGLDVVTVKEPFTSRLEPVTEASVTPGRARALGRYLAFGHDGAGLVTVARLLREGVEVRWALEESVFRGHRFPTGTFFVAGERGRAILTAAGVELGVDSEGVPALPRSVGLVRPRVGLYHSHVPSTDEGWMRYAFDRQAELSYLPLLDAEVRSGGLRSKFDVLVLPDQGPDDLLRGHEIGRLPPEFTGGLGLAGVSALRTFVEEGGWLVSVGRSSRFVLERFGLPIDDVAFGTERSANPVFGPGCILSGRLDTSHPLAHGLPRNVAVWYDRGPVFASRQGRTVLRYSGPNPLLSGGLLGGAQIASRGGLVEVPFGSGRLLLFGFRPAYRGQARGTLPLLLNALYLSAASAPTGPTGSISAGD